LGFILQPNLRATVNTGFRIKSGMTGLSVDKKRLALPVFSVSL